MGGAVGVAELCGVSYGAPQVVGLQGVVAAQRKQGDRLVNARDEELLRLCLFLAAGKPGIAEWHPIIPCPFPSSLAILSPH